MRGTFESTLPWWIAGRLIGVRLQPALVCAVAKRLRSADERTPMFATTDVL
jgi:hypothetical protein